MLRRIAAAAILAAALTACSDTEQAPAAEKTPNKPTAPASAPDPAAAKADFTGFGDYMAVGFRGEVLTLDVLTEPGDPRVAKVEKFRKAAGAPPFSYIVGELDNTHGKRTVYALELGVDVVTDDGDTARFMPVAAMDGVMEKHVLDKVDEAWPYYQTFYDAQEIRPGAKQPVILATTDEVPSVGGVWAILEQYGEGIQASRN